MKILKRQLILVPPSCDDRWVEMTAPTFFSFSHGATSLAVTQTSLLQTQVRKSAPSGARSPGDRTLLLRRPPSPPRSRSPVPAAATPPLNPGHPAPFSAKLFHQVQTGTRALLSFFPSFISSFTFYFFLSFFTWSLFFSWCFCSKSDCSGAGLFFVFVCTHCGVIGVWLWLSAGKNA